MYRLMVEKDDFGFRFLNNISDEMHDKLVSQDYYKKNELSRLEIGCL